MRPNVLLILLDDMGFGASSAFGGPCRMPVAERLAADGLRYTRFHTTAICSPTRAALLSGRNSHSVGMGHTTNAAGSRPGYNATRPPSKATLAQVLREQGYATGAFGKMHQTPIWETSPAGPFERWPTGEGFDHFYGFIGGETNQFCPTLVEGTRYIDPPATEDDGYHFSEDLVTQAGNWIRQQRTFAPERPWFAYVSFGATHAPFHVPASWRDLYRGEFAHGWTQQRTRTLARQRELGIVPPEAELAPWAPGVPEWDELPGDEKAVAARLMEVYAAFAEHTDRQVGHLVVELERLGCLDDTLVFHILGDNGASAEGGIAGTLNEHVRLNVLEEDTQRILSQLDEIGGPHTYPQYNVGWALAMDTPYQWTKQVASHYGGTRNGLIVHWPNGIAHRGELRHQWHHVIDYVPTVLEVIGIDHPATVGGVTQDPIEGTSMAYSFDDAHAPDRRTTQYFEIHGNRGLYHDGWTAVTVHRVPWEGGQVDLPELDEDRWELYDTTTDWTQAHDVAGDYPDRLAELKNMFEQEAAGYQVLPIDDRLLERLLPEIAGRPHAPRRMTLDPSMTRLVEEVVPNMKNASFRIDAHIRVSGEPAQGVIVSQGGRFGGWSLWVNAGHPTYTYNLAGLEMTTVRSDVVMPAGAHTVTVEFDYDGGGFGRGGTFRLQIDGTQVARSRIERTIPFIFSGDETLNIGIDRGTPVTDEYGCGAGNPFNGEIDTVDMQRGDDGAEVSAQDRLRVELGTH